MAQNKKAGRKPNTNKKDPDKNKKDMITIVIIGIGIVLGIILGMVLSTNMGTQKGMKEISVKVVQADSTKTIKISTSAEFLGTALTESKLAEGEKGAYGLMITTVSGYKADVGKQEWWCITKDGQEVQTGADSTPIKDGEKYELTLKTGY